MEKQTGRQTINNDFYDELDEGWYTSCDHPIALLRAENAVRVPWILSEILSQIGEKKTVLDIGCGAGLLTNALAQAGHIVHGIDLSAKSLEVAKNHDATQTVLYKEASGYALPYPDASFDVVCAMDLLEHVEDPGRVISEASRVLKKGGLFFFHTFNRNWLSYLLVIKGVEWFVPNAPKNMHVYHLFIKPEELEKMCATQGLYIVNLQGFAPHLFAKPFLKMVFTRKIPEDIAFRFSKSLKTGYCGCSKKI